MQHPVALEEMSEDQILVWRDPHGAYYLVDHTGTRRITDYPEAA